MSIQVAWLGHSTFQVSTSDKTFLIDPFLTDNPRASCAAADLEADVILLTHGHFDHVADAAQIAARTGALVVANYEVCQWIGRQGVKSLHEMNVGGRHIFDFGTVQLTPAHHSSSMPDGSYGGYAGGVLLKIQGVTIYHAGDTALFSDMALIGEEGIDLAILPIGDNYTMGPAASIRATQFLKPRKVVPCHYNTWPIINQDPHAWAQSIRQQTHSQPMVLQPGESLTLETDSYS